MVSMDIVHSVGRWLGRWRGSKKDWRKKANVLSAWIKVCTISKMWILIEIKSLGSGFACLSRQNVKRNSNLDARPLSLPLASKLVGPNGPRNYSLQ